MKDATTPQAPLGAAFGHDYGYLWHLKSMRWEGRKIPVFYANGYQGQAIFVSPDADVICVMTAGNSNDSIYSMEEGLFEGTILPSFK